MGVWGPHTTLHAPTQGRRETAALGPHLHSVAMYLNHPSGCEVLYPPALNLLFPNC